MELEGYSIISYDFYKMLPENYIDKILLHTSKVKKMEQRKKKEYYNIACSFDTETTSYMNNDKKFGFVYEWTFGIGDYIIYGRKIEDFVEMLKNVQLISENRRLVVYVHNLGFDFQFFRKYFDFDRVFSIKDRTPIKALTKNGIEFRCSYILSGKSLASIGKDLGCNKKVGDLDYEKIRLPITYLSDKEIEYCLYDIIVLQKYIKQKIEMDGDITKIPLTNTGYVRNMCRDKCLKGLKSSDYRKFIQRLKLEPEEYIMLKQLFSGGFVHANYKYVGETLTNLFSYDFTSSFIAVMLSEKFPMSKGRKINVKSDSDFWYYMDKYCCMFSVLLENIRSRDCGDHILSYSKCLEISKDVKLDNGRIIEASRAIIMCNEVDFIELCKFYSFDYTIVGDFYVYDKEYLPKELIECLLDLYELKTTLKGVKGKELDYMINKGKLNSIYGMLVTDVVRDSIDYNGDWSKHKAIVKNDVEKYNKDRNRFGFYPWGVWVTSYARKNLYSAILELGDDYVYSDTDSAKGMHLEDHIEYFKSYNKNIINKIKSCLNYYELDVNKATPETCKGEPKPLGVWDREDDMEFFKTLGAKRYMKKTKNGYELTCSGVSKDAIKYLLKFDNPFYKFDDELVIPADYTGKTAHYYCDDAIECIVKDYLGNEQNIKSPSSVYIEKSQFTLNMTDEFLRLVSNNICGDFSFER